MVSPMNHTAGLGEALEEARKAAGITQAEVAELLGISKATYWRRINGRAEFTATEAIKVRRRFGLDLLSID